MDKEVAERIMGWQRKKPEIDLGDGYEHWDGGPYSVSEWHPSTDISQAFEVVERMRELRLSFSMNNDNFPEDNEDWYAEFWVSTNKSTPDDVFCGWSNNPATAICKAALNVIERGIK